MNQLHRSDRIVVFIIAVIFGIIVTGCGSSQQLISTWQNHEVKIDDVITLSPKLQNNPGVLEILAEKQETLPFLKKHGPSGKLVRMPKTEDLQVPFDLQLIIEYYSR